jgi:hypothetical protein
MLLSALVAAGACVTPRRVQPLGEAVRIYNDSVRWQRFDMAAGQVPSTDRDDFLDRRDQLADDLRITGYEVIRMRTDRSGHRARAQIKFTWHLDSEGTVHDTHAVQTWRRHGARWVLVSEHHLRGEPMPGVDSPEPGDGVATDPDGPGGGAAGGSDEQGDDVQADDSLRHGVN